MDTDARMVEGMRGWRMVGTEAGVIEDYGNA